MVDLRGSPLDTSLLQYMDGTAGRSGGTPEMAWSGKCAAFWQIGHDISGALLVENDQVIISAARIDNKQEVTSLVGLRPGGDETAPSCNRIILKAFEKWSTGAVNRLTGDFAFALWDEKQRELFLARDHFGNTGLYYVVKDHVLVFSSFLKPLLFLPGLTHRPDDLHVAGLLTVFLPCGSSTMYEDIRRMPPAHYLLTGQGDVHVRKYYALEDTPSLRLQNDEAYVDAFREVFNRAVADRMAAPTKKTGVTLSGGLDSGAVAVTAARILKEHGRRLHAFTHVPSFSTDDGVDEALRFGDESEYVRKTAGRAGNIGTNWVTSPNTGPVSGQDQLLGHFPEPIYSAVNSFWLLRVLQRAQEEGIATLLTGQMGNATISWSGAGTLANLAKTWRWAAMTREAKSFSRLHGKPLWRILGAQVGIPLAPAFLYRFYSSRWKGIASVEDYSAIHPDFVRRINLLDRMRQRGHDPWFQPVSGCRLMQTNLIRPGMSNVGCFWHEAGHAFGIDILDPTLDRRVMEFCIAIPDDQYFKDGVDRRLVRRAFKGMMPDEVLLNRRKGLQSADIVYRIRHFAGEVDTALARLEQSQLAREYLDIDKMRQVFRAARSGKVTSKLSAECATVLMRGMMTGLCLTKYFKET